MDIFVYSDESGVFDKVHNDYYVYGGLIFLSKKQKDDNLRKYLNVEKTIRNNSDKYCKDDELKATVLSNKEKSKIYRSLNSCIKFGTVINQQKIRGDIFNHKKTKQRYLDYAYKIGLKYALEQLEAQGQIQLTQVQNIFIFVDEHTTATDGRYELREGLEREFRYGTYNYTYELFWPPICPNLKNLTVEFCNSKKKPLIRAADIVANRLYYMVVSQKGIQLKKNSFIKYLP